ncbi:MAG: TonB-dependent receptor [Edaphobacter sp.]|nr:TonB-dependent receptor [Edaphobacter sp.]
MRFSIKNVILLLASMSLGRLTMFAAGQTVQICVRDQRGDAIAGAQVLLRSARIQTATSDVGGCVEMVVKSGAETKVEVTHAGFSSVVKTIGGGPRLVVVMGVAGAAEEVQVTALRTPLALDASASSVRTMSPEQLREAPGFTLDDRLRQVSGFQLFRRTSSWVSNPTSQGTSLRGLGSTAASRTLVLSDQVPLNDAFGGWIHWNEIPQLAMREVELMRGGASDLYGSSAIGGVIDVIPEVPEKFAYAVNVAGANEGTSILNGLVTAGERGWSGLGAATFFRTDGYVLTAPEVRGPVDVASNVHSQSGRVELRRSLGTDGGVFLRGNLLNEARSNGTPLQTNATRIWRYAGGGDYSSGEVGRLMLRLYGTGQNYRQSFSSIAAGRISEKLTNLQRVPSQQVGGAVQWARSYGALTFVAGSDALDTRGTDNETAVSNGVQKPTVSISARQRGEGIYGEVLWQPLTWSIAFSSRVDWFDSFDARQVGTAVVPVLPDVRETVFDPRLGVVKQIAKGLSLNASVFRAFRGPTLNELYRTGQVGQQITLPNASLRSERATGFEAGGLVNVSRLGSVRTSYFWTQVNRPVAAVTLSSTATSQLLKRENLGQLTSRGITTEVEIKPASFLMLTGGYQYAVSTVTKFQADPTLVGRWTPQVPRNSASIQARLQKNPIGVLSVDLRTSGRQFDDSANQYKLDGYVQVDMYAEHLLRHNLRIYGSVQNLLDQPVQAGRTPILTLGAPRIVSIGMRLH